MSQESLTDAAPALHPVAGNERIAALDVVRGFALIGILLMNIEFFNRPTAQIGTGLPATLTGIDWWAGYFVYTFVQGKFWTMFSLLFGMGFAVMLTRAERAGRGFLGPYLRRIVALALFGIAHHIFLWSGDILFSYAVGAVCLLLLLWARWWLLLLIPLAAIGVAAAGFEWAGAIAFGVGVMAIAAIYLRSEARIGSAERGLPWLSLVFLLIGVGAMAASALAGNGPVPVDARWPSAILGSFAVLLGLLSWRYKDPREARPRRLGGTMYLTPFIMMFAFGVFMVYGPKQPVPSAAQVAAATVEVQAMRADREAGKPAAKPDPKAKPKTPVEKAALSVAQRRVQIAEQEKKSAKETRLTTGASYAELVRARAEELLEKAPGEFGFATLIVGMFLLGYWFVRTGIMERPADHLPLFRRMAAVGIPLGVGLGILGTQISTHMNPALSADPYQMAMALMMIGNLPACLGYVGLVVLLLHSRGPFARISALAPLGRMALTNYLTHSLLCSFLFYSYGLGWYGMGRASQVGFVFLVVVLQLVFCTWWLSKFRYGPMEWLWRAITYLQLPPMRRGAEPVLAGGASA